MTTLQDVIAFIASEADADDISRIHGATKQRTRTLRDIRAAAVKIGSEVKITDISPKYLSGMRGEVTEINGKHATVLLTKDDTDVLRYSGRRFFVPSGVDRYTLGGLPLSTLVAA